MPQHTQHSLVYVLLMWTALNTVFQVIFVTLFFTVGRNELSLNNSTNCGSIDPKLNMLTQPSPSSVPLLVEGKMITFEATGANDTITWIAQNPDTSVISESGNTLQIKRDGYYFFNLRVTLSACGNDNKQEHTVRLKSTDRILLEGWISAKTNGTGLFSKVEAQPAGNILMVSIDPPTNCVAKSDSVTHLDIIFMAKS